MSQAIGQLHVDAGKEAIGPAIGTGFAVTPALGVTCWHCVSGLAGAAEHTARVVLRVPGDPFGGHGEARCEARVAEHDADADLVLLEFDRTVPEHLTPLVLLVDGGRGRSWHATAWPAQVDGFAEGTNLAGEITGTRSVRGQPALTLDERRASAASPLDLHGASGAPVLVDVGEVDVAVGVLSRVLEDETDPERAVGGMAFAIPARQILDRWEDRIRTANPFKLPLQPFDVADGDVFFGRDEPLHSLRDAVANRRTRVITLMGASGSGKSSLVRAGLLGRHDHWVAGAAEAKPPPSQVIDKYGAACLDELYRFGETVEPAEAVLVLDQLEQLLFEAPDHVLAVGKGVSTLMASRPGLTVVLVLRTDYLSLFEALFATSWGRFIRDGLVAGGAVRLELSRSQLVEMCIRPAATAGISFAEGVVPTIVDALLESHSPNIGAGRGPAASPTVLPLLGITLWRLGEARGDARVITREQYERLGGVRGVLAEWADEAFRSAQGGIGPGGLDETVDGATRALRQVLLRLVRVGNNDKTPATREFVGRAALRELTDPPAEAEAAVRELEAAGLVYSDGDDTGDTVALRHDALITEWPMLDALVRGAQPTLRWKLRSFDADYDAWQSGGETAGRLRGPELGEADSRIEQTPEAFSDHERQYVADQRRSAHREARRRTARRIAAPVSAVVTAAVIVVIATLVTRQSDSAARSAVQAAANLETAATRLEASNPGLAQILLLEAYRQQPASEDGRNDLAQAVSIAPGLIVHATTTGTPAAMPDLSAIITPDPSFNGCADEQALNPNATPRTAYCGGGEVGQFAASPDSRLVAEVSGNPGPVRLTEWRRGTRRPLWSVVVDGGPAGRDTVNGGESSVAVADDGTTAVTDTLGLHVYVGPGHRLAMTRKAAAGSGVNLSANGRALIIAGQIRSTAPRGPTLRAITYKRQAAGFVPGPSWSLAAFATPVLTPDGRSALSAGYNGLQRLNLTTGRASAIPGPLGGASSLALSPSGELLAIGEDTAAVAIVDLRTGGTWLVPTATSDSRATNVAVDDRGDLVAQQVESWSYYSAAASRRVIIELPLTDSDLAVPVALSPDGTFAAVAATGSRASQPTLDILNLRTGVRTAHLAAPGLEQAVWDRAGRMIVAERPGRILAVGRDGRQRLLVAGPGRAPVAVDPTGRFAVIAAPRDAPTVVVYNLAARHAVARIPIDVRGAASIKAGPGAGRVSVTGTQRAATINAPLSRSSRVSYSTVPTGGLLSSAITSADGTVTATIEPAPTGTVAQIVRPASRARTEIPVPNVPDAGGVAVSDKMLGVLGADGEITIDTLNGKEWLHVSPPLSTQAQLGQPSNVIAFSPGGDRLATVSDSLRLFLLRPTAWLSSLCAADPALSSNDYRQYAGAGTEQPLCA